MNLLDEDNAKTKEPQKKHVLSQMNLLEENDDDYQTEEPPKKQVFPLKNLLQIPVK